MNQMYDAFQDRDAGGDDRGQTGLAFLTGTRIETLNGPRQIETLEVGDLVLTQDDGPQPVRWVSCRRLSAEMLWSRPDLRPVRFARRALGNTRPLSVAQGHRVLLSGWQAEAIFGAEDVLVPAAMLVNSATIRLSPPEDVEYWQLLFDRHHLIRADGILCESLHPGTLARDPALTATFRDLVDLFPDLAIGRLAGDVRRTLGLAERALL